MAPHFFKRLTRLITGRRDGYRLVTLHVTPLDLQEAEINRDPYVLISRPLERTTLPCTCMVGPHQVALDGHIIEIPPRVLDMFDDMRDGWVPPRPFTYVLELPEYLLPPQD